MLKKKNSISVNRQTEIVYSLDQELVQEPSKQFVFSESKHLMLFKKIQKEEIKLSAYAQKIKDFEQRKRFRVAIRQTVKKNKIAQTFRQKTNTTQKQSWKRRFVVSLNTKEEREQELKNKFLRDPKKLKDYQTESMLVQYYLRDEQKRRQNVSYMKKQIGNCRFRRLSERAIDTERVLVHHNEQQYKAERRKSQAKNQFMEKCLSQARRHVTFKRQQNFKELSYVLQNYVTIFPQSNLPLSHSQLHYSMYLRRLFLHFAHASQSQRHYYSYIAHQNYQQLITFLATAVSIPPSHLSNKIASITKYKSNQVLQFQDFKELFQHYSDQPCQMLNKIIANHPFIFTNPSLTIIENNFKTIDEFMINKKIKFILLLIFNSQREKMINKTLMAVKNISQLFKKFKITQKQLPLKKLYYNYLFVMSKNEGIQFDQFYKGSLAIGMKDEKWDGILDLLKAIDLQQMLK